MSDYLNQFLPIYLNPNSALLNLYCCLELFMKSDSILMIDISDLQVTNYLFILSNSRPKSDSTNSPSGVYRY